MRKRYALVGVGQRSRHFIPALLNGYAEHAELVALCDANAAALEARAKPLREQGAEFATYDAAEFDRMVAETQPETVIVLTPDHTHDEYVCRAMELGCDVIVEKPLATTAEKCRCIVETQQRTQRRCTVALNYRYAPWNTTIKELLVSGVIGRVVSVNMRKTLGPTRGPSYWHRWHGESAKSGGLLVHKVSHYYDLLNWFLASVPETVFARGERNFFTEQAARRLGLTRPGRRCAECDEAGVCPYYTELSQGPESMDVVRARGEAEGYYRDLCVFRPEADVPDTMHVMVRYRSGAVLNYSLVAFAQKDSETVLYGTHGAMFTTGRALRVIPYYGEPYEVSPPRAGGGHGGADPIMFDRLFKPDAPADALGCVADHHAGAWASLIGIAAVESMQTGRDVGAGELVPGLAEPSYVRSAEEPEGFQTAAMRRWVNGHTAESKS